MKIVEKMAESQGFGLVEKNTTKQKTGFGERNIETYALDKRQSIVVADRLNVDLQMRVIDRWIELESQNRIALPDFTNPSIAPGPGLMNTKPRWRRRRNWLTPRCSCIMPSLV